jgi:hypothetical protein
MDWSAAVQKLRSQLITAGDSARVIVAAVFVLLLASFVALPQFKGARQLLGLDWAWKDDGFFRDCGLAENQSDDVCRLQGNARASEQEWEVRRRTNGRTTLFSIP